MYHIMCNIIYLKPGYYLTNKKIKYMTQIIESLS